MYKALPKSGSHTADFWVSFHPVFHALPSTTDADAVLGMSVGAGLLQSIDFFFHFFFQLWNFCKSSPFAVNDISLIQSDRCLWV